MEGSRFRPASREMTSTEPAGEPGANIGGGRESTEEARVEAKAREAGS